MTPVTILHEAETELVEAVKYYDAKRAGLGLDFAREVEASIESVRRFPERWPLRADGTRRYLIQRFPYIVVYAFLNERIWILALAHCKRRSGLLVRAVTVNEIRKTHAERSNPSRFLAELPKTHYQEFSIRHQAGQW